MLLSTHARGSSFSSFDAALFLNLEIICGQVSCDCLLGCVGYNLWDLQCAINLMRD